MDTKEDDSQLSRGSDFSKLYMDNPVNCRANTCTRSSTGSNGGQVRARAEKSRLQGKPNNQREPKGPAGGRSPGQHGVDRGDHRTALVSSTQETPDRTMRQEGGPGEFNIKGLLDQGHGGRPKTKSQRAELSRKGGGGCSDHMTVTAKAVNGET